MLLERLRRPSAPPMCCARPSTIRTRRSLRYCRARRTTPASSSARARKHIAAERKAPVDSAEQKRLLEALVAAAQKGDLQRLEKLLAEDVVSYTDGNGMRGASRIPVRGRTVVAKFLSAFAPQLLGRCGGQLDRGQRQAVRADFARRRCCRAAGGQRLHRRHRPTDVGFEPRQAGPHLDPAAVTVTQISTRTVTNRQPVRS